MNRSGRFGNLPLLLLLLLLPCLGGARDIPPIVSTEWLQTNQRNPWLVVLDVRKVEQYREGHIPQALNLYYGAWAYKRGELYTEIPEADDLFDIIGSTGIGQESLVVVVGSGEGPAESYQSSRVACTLQYAGLENVALLDGGHSRWAREGRPLSTEVVKGRKRPFQGSTRREMFADKGYLAEHMGETVLLDVRESVYFSGEKKLDCIARSGHMPNAVNLPTSCAFTEEGLFKDKRTLGELAERAAGPDRSRRIVTYCDTGRCCPTWSYLLRELLGYREVRIYDGGMQEWMQDPQSLVGH